LSFIYVLDVEHRQIEGHKKPVGLLPAEHGPVHEVVDSPVPLPYVPAGHGAVHAAVLNPCVLPYTPAGQSVHVVAPAKLYFPTAHGVPVAVVEPAAQVCPASHGPEHAPRIIPVAEPYEPASHGPVHVAVGRPVVDPYTPAGHGVQTLAPPVLYFPAAHAVAMAVVDPAAHSYPARK
jgi:hypothetical protein